LLEDVQLSEFLLGADFFEENIDKRNVPLRSMRFSKKLISLDILLASFTVFDMW